MLRFLGRTCARHHWVVLALWLLVAVGASVAGHKWGGETTNDNSIPGSDSADALDILNQDFPQLAGTSARVVFEASTGSTISDFAAPVQQTVANLATIPEVASVSNPLLPSTELFNSQVSAEDTIAYATVLFTQAAKDLPADTYDKIVAASQNSVDAGLNVQFGGGLVDIQDPPTSTFSDYADEIGLAGRPGAAARRLPIGVHRVRPHPERHHRGRLRRRRGHAPGELVHHPHRRADARHDVGPRASGWTIRCSSSPAPTASSSRARPRSRPWSGRSRRPVDRSSSPGSPSAWPRSHWCWWASR